MSNSQISRSMTAMALPCGHLYHSRCPGGTGNALRDWMAQPRDYDEEAVREDVALVRSGGLIALRKSVGSELDPDDDKKRV